VNQTIVFWAVLVAAPLAPELPAQSKATIYRDPWGVPHIYADREEDGFYALGYATAHDELLFTLRMALSARGEAAAALGQEGLESDFTSRLWRHAAEAKVGFARLSPELQRNYRRWAQGFNRYLADHPAEVPAWAPRLTEIDPVAISRWMLWLAYQAGDGLSKCRASGVQLSAASEAGLANRAVAASNEWVVAPWRTASGSTVVLSDPHGGVDGQFVYEFRMHAGRLALAGYAVGAMPLLVQTKHVSWGMTTGAPSVADCYEVTLEPGRTDRYLYDGKPQPIIREPVVIAVKGAAPVTRTLEYTRHNGVLSPVVARKDGKVWVVSTTYMDRAGDFDEEVYRMVLARNVGEIKAAMRIQGMFPQNVMVGDAEGGTFYVRAGRTPRRPPATQWRRALDGNSSATAWLGIHPFEDLVQIENPTTGYMQNNNIGPDRMFEGSPLKPDRYPDYIYNDQPGRTNSRGRRAVDVLSRAVRFTVEDAVDLALDESWVDTGRWQEAIRKGLDARPERLKSLSPVARGLLDRLVRFDGNARAESRAALGFWYWRTTLLAQAGVAGAAAVLESAGPGEPTVGGSADGAAAPDRVFDALEAAAATMAKEGRADAALGDVFRIGRPGGPSYPVGGVAIFPDDRRLCQGASASRVCVHTLRAFTAGRPDSGGLRHAEVGSRLLRLTIFSQPIQSFTLHNFGQTARADSPHRDDQAKLTSERRLKPVLFEQSELMPRVVGKVELEVPK
jgi:acyl-homoserine lactone acylase PvdQ